MKRNKICCLVLILTILASILVGCGGKSAEAGLTDGTYESEAKGNNGPVKVYES